MKIRIPHFAAELEDEGIILWLAFILRMTKKDNKFGNNYKRVRYYMHVSDIRYFVRKWIMTPDKMNDQIWPWCRLGKANTRIWMFEWLHAPETIDYDLTDPELCAIWGYVLGRDASSQLVEDMDYSHIPEEQPAVLTNRYDKNFFQYFGNREGDNNPMAKTE